MKKWEHTPLKVQNPFKFLEMLNSMSEYLEHLSDSIVKAGVLEESKKRGRPTKKATPKKKVEEPAKED